jgi:hypothetical protein
MDEKKRNMYQIVYGHQESFLSTLLNRKVYNIAILRNPYNRYESEVNYLRRQGFKFPTKNCIPNEEQVKYIWMGNEFRKSEPRWFFPNEQFYNMRRIPTSSEFIARVKSFLFIGTIESQIVFERVAKILSLRFPKARHEFVCNTRLNTGIHVKKLNVTIARLYNRLDESLWSHCHNGLCGDIYLK